MHTWWWWKRAGPTTDPGGDGVRFTGSGGGGNYPQYPLTGYGGKGADGIVIVKYSVHDIRRNSTEQLTNS